MDFKISFRSFFFGKLGQSLLKTPVICPWRPDKRHKQIFKMIMKHWILWNHPRTSNRLKNIPKKSKDLQITFKLSKKILIYVRPTSSMNDTPKKFFDLNLKWYFICNLFSIIMNRYYIIRKISIYNKIDQKKFFIWFYGHGCIFDSVTITFLQFFSIFLNLENPLFWGMTLMRQMFHEWLICLCL